MKALVLAGGFPQIALLKELSKRNIKTVLADYYENPIAKPYADKFYRASTLDVEAITNIADNDKFVIFRGIYTQEKTEAVNGVVQKIAQQIADSFGLKNSPMLIQMIYDGENAYVLEFSARTGGGIKHLLIKKVADFDVLSAVVDLTHGVKPRVKNVLSENKYIVNDFIYCNPGKFNKLSGFEELKKEGIISDYYLFKCEGTVFDTIENSGDRVGGFTVQADTPEDLHQKHSVAVERMKVLDENGKDIMRKDLLTHPDLKGMTDHAG